MTLAVSITALSALAQNGVRTVLLARPEVASRTAVDKTPSPGQLKDLVSVMNEDFANGLAGNTPFGAWTTDGPDGAIWLYDTNGPNGDFSDPSEKIQSTTVANGFMIFDSNLSNPGAAPNNRVGYLLSPVMDLTATPDVQLKFEHRFRWCCSGDAGHWVDVSTDGGLSFPTRINVGEGALNQPMVTNLDIGTHTKWVDISQAVSANPSAVVIRFAHEDMTDGNISHYHWQIDDVELFTSPGNDLQFTQNQYDDFIPSTFVLDGNSVNLEYTLYPHSQLHELTLKSRIRNGGMNTATNVDFSVEVLDPSSSSVFGQTSTLATMPRYESDSLQLDGFTPPATNGEFTVNFTLSSDSIDDRDDDNSFTKNFSVDEFDYGYDDDAMNGRASNGTDPFEVANKFFIHNTADAYGVKVAFATAPSGSPSPVGQVVKANVYDGNGDWVAETEDHEIVSGDLNGGGGDDFTTLLFSDPLEMIAPGEFLVALQSFGGGAVYVATSGVSEVGSSLLIEPETSDPDAQFFIQNNTPMVRLTFDPSVGVEENDYVNGVGLGQNHPNPADGTTIIPFNLTTGGAVTFDVHDMSGKLVTHSDLGTKNAGPHRFIIDTTTMPEGVYFYTLNTGGVQVTKRMTVIR